MFSRTSAVLATAVVGTALAAAPAALAAPAQLTAAHIPSAASWHTVLKVGGANFPEFAAVTATSATSAWAFSNVGGLKPAAYKLTGSAWVKNALPVPVSDAVISASSSSASNVWALTFQGRVLRYNGSWSVVKKFGGPVGSVLAVSSQDVWVFGAAVTPALGTWHYDGSAWIKVPSGHGLDGASALSAKTIWGYGGTSVARWNGGTWTRTNLSSLLPKNTLLSHSYVAGIYAASAHNVYAVASGGRQDEGGPLVLLHYNGSSWRRIAEKSALGDPVTVIPDGHGGLWIPVNTGFPGNGSMEHYSHGALSSVTLPYGPLHLRLFAAAIGRNTTAALAVGYSRKSFSSSTTTGVVLRYGS